MSRKTWESLFRPDAEPDPEAPVTELMRSFAQAAATRRAARDLAQEELLDGVGALEDEPIHAPVARLAAQDPLPAPRVLAAYAAGPHRLSMWVGPSGAVLVRHDQGPAGVTLEVDGRFVPLQPGRPADLGTLAELPDRLRLQDAAGRTWTLTRS